MSKTLKKLLALLIAMILALQWAPALAAIPVYTVDGKDVTVTTEDDLEFAYANTHESDGARFGSVWVDGAISLVDEDGNPLADIESITLNTGALSESRSGGYVMPISINAETIDKDISVTANVKDVTAVNKTERGIDYEVPIIEQLNNISANTQGVTSRSQSYGEGSGTVQINVDGNVSANSTAQNSYASAVGITLFGNAGKINVEAKDVEANAQGVNITYAVETGEVDEDGNKITRKTNRNSTATGISAQTSGANESDSKEGIERNVKAGDVTANASPVEGALGSSYNATGINANSGTLNSTVSVSAGNVTVKAEDPEQQNYVNARGVFVSTNGSKVASSAKDVSVTVKGQRGYASGAYLSVSDAVVDGREALGEGTVKTGDITVEAEGNTDAYGISVYSSGSKDNKATAELGNITINATDESDRAYAAGILQTGMGGQSEVTAKDINVTVEGGNQSEAIGANVRFLNNALEDTDRKLTAGNVTAELKTTEITGEDYSRTYVNGVIGRANVTNTKIDITVGNVVANNENKNDGSTAVTTGVNTTAQGSEVSVQAGDVSANIVGGNTEVEAVGVRASAYENWEYDEATDSWTPVAGNVNIKTGSVTATAAASEEARRTAIGILADASDGSTVNITADGDVTATGSKGPNALNLTARYGGAINVTATGTVSAGDGATPIWLNFLDGPEEEQDEKTVKSSVGLTMWAVKPNSDGEIVRAYNAKWEKMTDEETGEEYYRQTGNEYSKEKSQQIEAAINYIVKVAEEFVDKITVGTEKGNTVRVGDKTYTFFNQNGIWKLFQIENGVYVEVVE